MRQKNQVKLNLGTGGAGEARDAASPESEIRAAKPALNARRPRAVGGLEVEWEKSPREQQLNKVLLQPSRTGGVSLSRAATKARKFLSP